jgi:hypothetical protein
MQKKMGTTLTYTHEDGMNYNRILPDLIVGSCLQTPEDLDYLREKEDVRTIFCLQVRSQLDLGLPSVCRWPTALASLTRVSA